MAHHTVRSGYRDLIARLNRFPQGAAPSDLLFRILAMLFSEREAALVSQLPIRPFTAQRAARIWRMTEPEAREVLDALAERAILLDIDRDGETTYVLPPPMAGFFEFSMMRIRHDIDQQLLAQLFYQYLNVEEDFIRNLFARGETQLGRVFAHEPALPEDGSLHVLDYERASEVIRAARHRGVGVCYCRHKMRHVGRDCDAPKEICMTFNSTADSLIRHGHARPIDVAECLDLLQEAHGRSLVQFGENARQDVSFICNCCGCCCEALIAARRFALMHPVHTTNYLPQADEFRCGGTESAEETVTALTSDGSTVGTLAYMSHEQLRNRPVDGRSDIWALGVTLYEMAAGTQPFHGQSGVDLTSAIVSQPPRPLPSQVPAELVAVIERCLEKEPGKRYQEAVELRAALEAVRAGTVAPWVAWRYRAERHRWLVLAATLLIVAAILVGLGIGGLRGRLTGGSRVRVPMPPSTAD